MPMPVPKVSMMTEPVSPRPAPQRISARPAASASFRNTQPTIQRAPDQRGAIGTDPGMIDVGGGARLAASDDTREARGRRRPVASGSRGEARR